MWEDKERMKKQTEDAIKSMPIGLMKHFDGSSAFCGYNDGVYKLIKSKSHELVIYKSIDELSDAGWTID